MNRLARFRFGNLHKRRFFFLLLLIILILVTSMLFLMFLGFFGSRSELPRIRASAELTSERTEGIGINVLEIPDANIIDDPFFGSQDNFISAQITEAKGNYIYFDPSVAASFDSQSIGDTVTILSIDSSGNMGLRYSGQSVGFAETMFGVPVALEDPSALWINDTVFKTLESSGSLYLLTQSGKIISNAALNPTDESVAAPFVDMCKDGISVYAINSIGEIYISTDTSPFTLLGTCQIQEGITPLYISVVNGNIDVFMTDGSIYSYTSTGSTEIGHIEATSVVTGSGYMMASTEYDVYVSRNGIFITRLESMDEFLREGDYICDIEASDDSAFILTSYGRIIRIDMSEEEPSITARDISSIEPVCICPSGSDGIIAVTSDNQSYYVSAEESAPKSLGLTGIAIDDIMMYGEDRYIIRSGNFLYEASIKAALEVDLPIADGLIIEGDICIVKGSAADTGAWDLYGNTSLVSQSAGVSIIGNGDDLHAVSRLLDRPSEELFEDNLFYRIEITTSCDTPGTYMHVWLEGYDFGTEGIHISEVSSQPQTYSYVFAVTDTMLSDEPLRFNISFEGDAMVNVYNVYVGLDRYDINSVPTEFTDMIVSSAPSALRFDSIVPGSNGYCEDTFYGVSAYSLERAMVLSKDSGANPWIVFGSSISQEDVDNFLGYMCGSVSNVYGKMRIDNGTALPWSRQFDTIYIEIGDSDNIFPSDSQRGAYVTYVMSLFSKSEFYLEIKDKIIFVDAMNYEGGTMMSGADRHAMDIVIDNIPTEQTDMIPFMSASVQAIENAIYRTPRAGSSLSNGGEFISSLRISDVYTADDYDAADIVSTILRAEGMFSDIIMIDSDSNMLGVIPTLRSLVNGELMYCEILDPLDASSLNTADSFNSACETMLIDRSTSVFLIVSNHSDTLQQFTVISDAYDTSNGSYIRYSSTGAQLMERDLNHIGAREVLQPGEYMVIEIPK